MIDITHKSNTLREAIAQATLSVSMPETMQAIKEGTVPKGDVFASSKAVGLLGVKRTAELLPDCHPMPIEYTAVEFDSQDLEIVIRVTVKTIYKTGVEVEAMHGASLVALNMYDMLKPIDQGIEIRDIKLISKKGGKSSYPRPDLGVLSAAVIVCSDSLSAGIGEDRSGELIRERLSKEGLRVAAPVLVPDEQQQIAAQLKDAQSAADLVVLTGGTGLADRDVTPEAILPLLDKRLHGVEEKIRAYGQERMPYAMLSRSVVGTMGHALVLALPGSSAGVSESLDAVLPHLFHAYKVLQGERHEV